MHFSTVALLVLFMPFQGTLDSLTKVYTMLPTLRNFVLVCLGLGMQVMHTDAADPKISYTSANDAVVTTTVNINMKYYKEQSATTYLFIADAAGAAIAECQFLLTSLTSAATGEYDLDIVIEGSQMKRSGSVINCHFETNGAGNKVVYVDARESNTVAKITDVRYTVESDGDQLTQTQYATVSTVPGVPVAGIALTPTSHTLDFTVVGPSDLTPLTAEQPLGAAIRLHFTMTIANFIDKLDYKGARLHTCDVSNNAGFTENTAAGSYSRQFIDANGCFTAGGIVQTASTTQGFTFLSSTPSGSDLVFQATTVNFEVAGFAKASMSGSNSQYFRCKLDYCVQQGSAAGQCGGNHCAAPAARKKRESAGDQNIVNTMVKVQKGPTVPSTPCCMSQLVFEYFVTLGILAFMSAVMFVAMVLSYCNLRVSVITRIRPVISTASTLAYRKQGRSRMFTTGVTAQ